jgi:putative methanogen marker protein 4
MIKIIIGLGKNKNIIKAIKKFEKNKEIEIKTVTKDSQLIESILNPEIDAVIRGSLPSNNIIKQIKKTHPQTKINRATFINNQKNKFLIMPVGIDEGKTPEEKIELIKQSINFINKINEKPKIAILAKGRKDDENRSKIINQSLEESENLTKILQKQYPQYKIKNYYILIEQAIKDKNNIILAPDGIIGNIIFRTLVLIDNWPSMGAITLGIPEIYIDTSRDQTTEGYERSIELAYELAKKQ